MREKVGVHFEERPALKYEGGKNDLGQVHPDPDLQSRTEVLRPVFEEDRLDFFFFFVCPLSPIHHSYICVHLKNDAAMILSALSLFTSPDTSHLFPGLLQASGGEGLP